MPTYTIEILSHYSGMMSGRFPDWPSLSVLGRDHDDVVELARGALEAEVDRYAQENRPLPTPACSSGLKISVIAPNERVPADF